tara:strand:+ start:201 stop:617 length:417 start_codon:yes stop_codon:yes gene_type:complete
MILESETKIDSGIEFVGSSRLPGFVGLVQLQDMGATGPKETGQRSGQSGGSTELTDGDSLVDEIGSTSAETVQFPHLGYRLAPCGPSQKATESVHGERPGDSVRGEADVPLEVRYGRGGVWSENAVDPAGVEAQASQT